MLRPLILAAALALGTGTTAHAAPLVLPDAVSAEFAKGPKWKGGKGHGFHRGRAYGHRALPGRRLGWYKRGYRPARYYYYR